MAIPEKAGIGILQVDDLVTVHDLLGPHGRGVFSVRLARGVNHLLPEPLVDQTIHIWNTVHAGTNRR